MTESEFLNLTKIIEQGDVHSAQAALESAASAAGAAKIGKATIKSNEYVKQKDVLNSIYLLEVTEAGFDLRIVGVIITASNKELVELNAGLLKSEDKTYVGLNALTGLAQRYKGQTLTVFVFGIARDPQNKKIGGFSTSKTVTIS